ncbi:unnamed protein product [Moneuplotes crassus]|uniref:Uncharacterized protein n=1 Tax=Euplotes crassus TaxID=5936 RepID=A0AAD1Y042_EUPCR|nr:unnamed protein product [Moneuplotes crassus]
MWENNRGSDLISAQLGSFLFIRYASSSRNCQERQLWSPAVLCFHKTVLIILNYFQTGQIYAELKGGHIENCTHFIPCCTHLT